MSQKAVPSFLLPFAQAHWLTMSQPLTLRWSKGRILPQSAVCTHTTESLKLENGSPFQPQLTPSPLTKSDVLTTDVIYFNLKFLIFNMIVFLSFIFSFCSCWVKNTLIQSFCLTLIPLICLHIIDHFIFTSQICLWFLNY